MDLKKNDFIKMYLKMFLEYETTNEWDMVETRIKFFDNDNNELQYLKYNNGNFFAYQKFVFLNKNIFYNFEKDTESLKIEIEFRYNTTKYPLGVDDIWYIPKNNDRCIIKHYKGLI